MELLDIVRYAVLSASMSLVFLGDALHRGGRSRAVCVFLKVLGYSALALLTLFQPLNALQQQLLLITAVLGALISLFSAPYSTIKYGSKSLTMITDLLIVTTAMTFASRYLLELVLFWLAAELIGFIAIAYDAFTGVNSEALRASIRYLVFSMIPTDISLFILLALTGFEEMLSQPLATLKLKLCSPMLTGLLTLGFMAKAAIAPLHFWLPDAHSLAPAPASATLSGLMVKMGVYGMLTLAQFAIDTSTAYSILLVFGSLTAVYGGLQAVYQRDLKRLLAYSTVSHMGAIVMLVALYIDSQAPLYLYAIMAYVAAHASYKATLFMDTGVIELLSRERFVDRLGYVHRALPVESLAALLAILTIFGVPPTAGFLAKVWAFSSVLHSMVEKSLYIYPLSVLSIEIALCVAYSARYLQAHIKPGSVEEVSSREEVRGLPMYTLAASLTSLALVLPLLAVQSSGEKMGVDYFVLYLASLPTVLLLLTALHILIREAAKGCTHGATP